MALLRAYFYSGWAFLIPYLAIYLLYYWQKWPANPASGMVKVGSENVAAAGSWIPPLLYVYWTLHLTHVALAIVALRSCWHDATEGSEFGVPRSELATTCSMPNTRYSPLAHLVPWALLALIFAIPGVYLEWPSDPWEHLRRITEWQTHSAVGGHSAGYKSFYFFAYSLVGWISPSLLLSWLNVYYVAICMLLAWQYYLLAKAVGLDSRWAFLFVIVNVLTFGNSCFSFYRYYGLASTIFAQLGAVTLTRMALTAVSKKHETPVARLRHTLLLLVPGSLLLVFTAFNHIQAIGIGAISVLAILAWRLVQWKRSAVWWLALSALLANVAVVLWLPRDGTLITYYRSHGWLTAYLGFNLFDPSSPAFDRSMHIIGIIGALNLVAALWLVCRNQVAGWLTVMPLILLALPFVALPVAHAIGIRTGGQADITFQRLFFAVPSGLAAVFCVRCGVEWASRNLRFPMPRSTCIMLAGVAALLLLTLLSPGRISYNRFWQQLAVTPHDLNMRDIISASAQASMHVKNSERSMLLPTVAAYVSHALAPNTFVGSSSRFLHDVMTPIHENLVARVYSSRHLIEQREKLFEAPSASQEPTHRSAVMGTCDVVSMRDFPGRTIAYQNRLGVRGEVFNRELIPIDPARRYVVQISAISRDGKDSNTYLAVAWYDSVGRLLKSHAPAPEGAAEPSGWSNGTYSYYGLAGRPAASTWTTYRQSFGGGARATIPWNARFIRIGALLNFNAAPNATTQVTNLALWAQEPTELISSDPYPNDQYSTVFAASLPLPTSPASQAAIASRHWGAQRVALETAGTSELDSAAETVGYVQVDGSLSLLQHRREASPP